MAQSFKETAHLKTDLNKYGENYDHIFRKYKCNCHLFEEQVCDTCQNVESQAIKDSDKSIGD